MKEQTSFNFFKTAIQKELLKRKGFMIIRSKKLGKFIVIAIPRPAITRKARLVMSKLTGQLIKATNFYIYTPSDIASILCLKQSGHLTDKMLEILDCVKEKFFGIKSMQIESIISSQQQNQEKKSKAQQEKEDTRLTAVSKNSPGLF